MIVGIGRPGKYYDEYIVLNKKQLAMCFAPRKYEIKEAIAELRCSKQLPFKNAGYKPNYEGIKNVYAINAAKLLKLEDEKRKNKSKNKVDATASAADDINVDSIININSTSIITILPIDIVSKLYINMLKEIILCDYNHANYNAMTDDDLLSSVKLVKSRKKVILTRKKLCWPNGPFKPMTHPAHRFYKLDENRIYYEDPDDDAEEREERRKLKQRWAEGERRRIIYEETEYYPALEKQLEEQDETRRQLDDLSDLTPLFLLLRSLD